MTIPGRTIQFAFILLYALTGFCKSAPADSLPAKRKFKPGLVLKADMLALTNIAYYKATNRALFMRKYFSFRAEKLLAGRHAVQLTLMQTVEQKWLPGSWTAWIPEYKFFITKKKPQSGWFVGGNAKYIRYQETSSNSPPPQSASDPTTASTAATLLV